VRNGKAQTRAAQRTGTSKATHIQRKPLVFSKTAFTGVHRVVVDAPSGELGAAAAFQ
jgi:hypothetical protein